MIEDELLVLLGNSGVDGILQKNLERSRLINQDLTNSKTGQASPVHGASAAEVEEMKKQGKVWDGYRWV